VERRQASRARSAGRWQHRPAWRGGNEIKLRLSAFRFPFSLVRFFPFVIVSFVISPSVIIGHSRWQNGVVSLAYAGNPCGTQARSVFPETLVAAPQHGPPDQVRR